MEGPDPTRRIPDPTRRLDATQADRSGGHPVLGGRYRLEGLLGSGGMADVHRAEDLRLHRPVAVKVFRPGTDPDGERRFEEEARMLAGLRHPGLVAVHDFAVEQRRAFLVMELVDGPTLAAELARERYDAAGATQLGLELARVIAYVHGEGVVHRDVKPSNILVDHDGRVRLADFGVSRLVGESGLTSAERTVGYLSPEEVRGEPARPPADVYALGLVLLEALSGRREYPGDGWDAADERLHRPPSVPRDLPQPLRSTLAAMTATDPQHRPDAREVAARLGRPPVPDAPPAGVGGRALLVALAVVAVIAVAVLALTRGDDPADPAAQPAASTSATAEPTEDAEETADPQPEEEPADGGSVEIPTAIPDLPDIDLPTSIPDLPDIPQPVQDDARNLWEQFTDWFAGLF